MTQLTLVGDEGTPPLERRRKKQNSPPTSPIREESDEEDEVDMDSLLEEIKLNDYNDKAEGSKEEKEGPESSTVTVTATVHTQRDTS